MKVVIHGTKNFDQYPLFLRGMHHVLANLDESRDIVFFFSGPANIKAMLTGFLNITEDTRKLNRVKAKIVSLPPSEIKKKVGEIDKIMYFCNPKDNLTDLVKYFQNKDDETKPDFVTVWRF